jgi:hypothetical protein
MDYGLHMSNGATGEDNAIHLPLELLKSCRIAINTYSMNLSL